MKFRVCIPTAGTGSRLGQLTTYLNKSLVSVGLQPTLSRQIDLFPLDTEFVIGLGYKGHLVREFLELAYPERSFYFAEVDHFEGPGSGLGLTLLACKEYLQEPFVFLSCDTLITEPVPPPEENWMGYAQVGDVEAYRTLAIEDEQVTAVCEKGVGQAASHKAYIGLAGIHDYQEFWSNMKKGGHQAIATGEVYGLRPLVSFGMRAHEFTWFDTGNPEAISRAREVFHDPEAPNILDKPNEAIWFVGGQVIKFSDDPDFIANRVQRARRLAGFVPTLTGDRSRMYAYRRIQGQVLSEVVTRPLFDGLLTESLKFWTLEPLPPTERSVFKGRCLRFYRDKTLERVALFQRRFSRPDRTEDINGEPMPTLTTLMDAVDWDWLAEGTPVRFHGDFHFENILWDEKRGRFTFLDWRQDFGGDLSVGDLYYDLAKLLHGLIISHEMIARDLYQVEWGTESIRYDFHRKQILVQCERQLDDWLEAQSLDRVKTRLLTALIYLNIAALHHHPYSLLLYALGKTMLKETLET